MSAGPSGMVFRDGARRLPRGLLVRAAEESLARVLRARPSQRRAALQRALQDTSALECALADAASPITPMAAGVTDAVAMALAAGADRDWAALARRLSPWSSTALVRTSIPEGFAYYDLRPGPFAEAASALVSTPAALVVGIRTIGVALSAMVRAALLARGVDAARVTTRPVGHPYDRRVALDPRTREEVDRCAAAEGTFLIVDEGPGLSGSSFLAAAEALEAAGAKPGRVLLVGTRAVDPDTLVAPEGGRRWRRFTSVAVNAPAALDASARDLSAGAWRSLVLPDAAAWPPSWAAMERRKLLAADGSILTKFEGLGRYGDVCHQRGLALAAAAWTPAPLGPPDEHGMVSYPWLRARPFTAADATPALAAALGRYAAARTRLCPADGAEPADLQEMARVNVALELGDEIVAPALTVHAAVVPDARMQPHEWLQIEGGALVKVDAVSHGDDHFYPGPTDAAWDLAGAVVEWHLGRVAREAMLEAYTTAAGEDLRSRLRAYEIAYAAFRARYALMAAHASTGEDADRWRKSHRRYRAALLRAVRS